MPRGDRHNWGGLRVPIRPDAKPPGRPRKHRQLRLAEADAALLEQAVAPLDLEQALTRIAAAAAADPDGTRAALAPLLAVEAWDGKEVL